MGWVWGPWLTFSFGSIFRGGEEERAGREDSLRNSSSVDGLISCFVHLSGLGLRKPSWWTHWEPQPCHPPSTLLLWELQPHIPLSGWMTSWRHSRQLCFFLSPCIYRSVLNLSWSWASHPGLQLVHCFGMWQMVRVQFILQTLFITERPLFQEQSYSPSELKWHIWTGLLGSQHHLYLVYWFLIYLGCFSFSTMLHQGQKSQGNPSP